MENIALDNAVFKTHENRLPIIQATADHWRWLPLGLLSGLFILLLLLLWTVISTTLGNFSLEAFISGLVQFLVVSVFLFALAILINMQRRALQLKTVAINHEQELIELRRPTSIRRIPFDVITEIQVVEKHHRNTLERVENTILRRLNFERYGVTFRLKHGETLWIAVSTGESAQQQLAIVAEHLNRAIGR